MKPEDKNKRVLVIGSSANVSKIAIGRATEKGMVAIVNDKVGSKAEEGMMEHRFRKVIRDNSSVTQYLGRKSKKSFLRESGFDTFKELEKEYNLIQEKKSQMSSNARASVVHCYESIKNNVI